MEVDKRGSLPAAATRSHAPAPTTRRHRPSRNVVPSAPSPSAVSDQLAADVAQRLRRLVLPRGEPMLLAAAGVKHAARLLRTLVTYMRARPLHYASAEVAVFSVADTLEALCQAVQPPSLSAFNSRPGYAPAGCLELAAAVLSVLRQIRRMGARSVEFRALSRRLSSDETTMAWVLSLSSMMFGDASKSPHFAELTSQQGRPSEFRCWRECRALLATHLLDVARLGLPTTAAAVMAAGTSKPPMVERIGQVWARVVPDIVRHLVATALRRTSFGICSTSSSTRAAEMRCEGALVSLIALCALRTPDALVCGCAMSQTPSLPELVEALWHRAAGLYASSEASLRENSVACEPPATESQATPLSLRVGYAAAVESRSTSPCATPPGSTKVAGIGRRVLPGGAVASVAAQRMATCARLCSQILVTLEALSLMRSRVPSLDDCFERLGVASELLEKITLEYCTHAPSGEDGPDSRVGVVARHDSLCDGSVGASALPLGSPTAAALAHSDDSSSSIGSDDYAVTGSHLVAAASSAKDAGSSPPVASSFTVPRLTLHTQHHPGMAGRVYPLDSNDASNHAHPHDCAPCRAGRLLYADSALHLAVLNLLLRLVVSANGLALASWLTEEGAQAERAHHPCAAFPLPILEAHLNHAENAHLLPAIVESAARAGAGHECLPRLLVRRLFRRDTVRLGQTIGRGRFGAVVECALDGVDGNGSCGGGGGSSPPRRVAKLVSRVMAGRSKLPHIYEEVLAMRKMASSGRSVPLVDYGIDWSSALLVMPRCEGTMGAWRRAADRPLAELLRMCGEALTAACAMHAHLVEHFDLKADNFLLYEKWDDVDRAVSFGVLLSDFGSARIHTARDGTWSPRSDVGTELTNSPEMLTGGGGKTAARARQVAAGSHTAADALAAPHLPRWQFGKCDVWAAGCLVFEVLAGDMLFREDWTLFYTRLTSDVEPLLSEEKMRLLPSSTAGGVETFLGKVLVRDAAARPSMQGVCAAFDGMWREISERNGAGGGGTSRLPEIPPALSSLYVKPRGAWHDRCCGA